MTDIAIKSENLSKLYHIGEHRAHYKALRDKISQTATAPFRRLKGALRSGRQGNKPRRTDGHIWALNDVSFSVRRGEVMGVIGRNGAGKSTLLKVLSRITEPTRGYADINGRVGSLLEVGTGFHPELTGGENIYLNGAILGMRKAEIKRKFDEIVAFAEVEKFIDTPVKHYSSGMYLRLAFAVAAHLEPDILMIDEVLAVGDLAFQRKCMEKMQDVGGAGQTVLFVSHDMTAISRLAPMSLVMQDGAIAFCGPTREAIGYYTARRQSSLGALSTRVDRGGDGIVRLESIRFYDSKGREVDHVGCGESVDIAVTYSSRANHLRYQDLALDMRLTDMLGHPVTTFSTRFSHHGQGALGKQGTLMCHVPSLSLAEETYGIDLWLAYRGGLSDRVVGAGELRVVTANYYGTGQEPVKRKHGPALVPHRWTAEQEALDLVPAAIE